KSYSSTATSSVSGKCAVTRTVLIRGRRTGSGEGCPTFKMMESLLDPPRAVFLQPDDALVVRGGGAIADESASDQRVHGAMGRARINHFAGFQIHFPDPI